VTSFPVSHLSNGAVEQGLQDSVRSGNTPEAWVLAYVAEYDARKLWVAKGYSSMFRYCLGVLNFSEDAACRRIQAARVGRRFPVILDAIASGRVHLTAINLLAPHLTHENVEELLAAADHHSKADIEQLIACRFPMPDLPTRIGPIAQVGAVASESSQSSSLLLTPASPSAGSKPDTVPQALPVNDSQSLSAPARMNETAAARVKPLSADSVGIQGSVRWATHEKLLRLASLCGHRLNDLDAFLSAMCDVAIPVFERRKFAASDRPRTPSKPAKNPRTIPAYVKRAVWRRDGGCCTFVAADGHRCEARDHLEFDHVDPIAQGGLPTIRNVRLRCRAHNQYDAEQKFGSEFMRRRREYAREQRDMAAAARLSREVVLRDAPAAQVLRSP